MPVLTVYPRGLTAGFPPGRTPPPPTRTAITGWSTDAIRRNTVWLYSVDAAQLPPGAVAATLTLRDCPPSPEDWQRLRARLLERLRRAGLARLHWVVEWQRRGVPHLHVAIWLDGHTPDAAAALVLRHWLAAAADYRARASGQHVQPLRDADGWAQYVSKHAARGLAHYQRSPEARPAGWATSGRMWGHCGDWPTVEGERVELGDAAMWQMRRWVSRWVAQQADRRGDAAAARWARTWLSRVPADRSRWVGISDWVPAPTIRRFLAGLPLEEPRRHRADRTGPTRRSASDDLGGQARVA